MRLAFKSMKASKPAGTAESAPAALGRPMGASANFCLLHRSPACSKKGLKSEHTICKRYTRQALCESDYGSMTS